MGVQLPAWVWVGGGVLASVAGMVNVAGVLGFEHQALTHLTGTATLLGAAAAAGRPLAALQLFGVIAAYLAGAMLSGAIVQGRSLRLGRRYGVVLSIESALLFAAVPLFRHAPMLGGLTGAMAMGLQNAMATTFSGSVLRTTHLTGMFTDLGIGLGHALRGQDVPRRRILLSALVICGFLAGAALGAALYRQWGYRMLYLPAVLTGAAGSGYALYRQLRPFSD
ncbi:YoaK family protein [Lysobacter yananisis]|uniref:YoaK family protein n=1 Tax=Lysobacter yananisis TaxID=1003114 RepID=A0ABY9P7D9_9GAMM|nr:YoaK family protein [Lysobacter yananisis]WMT02990.1 YoaK family protein [Lysobacter yananisis]